MSLSCSSDPRTCTLHLGADAKRGPCSSQNVPTSRGAYGSPRSERSHSNMPHDEGGHGQRDSGSTGPTAIPVSRSIPVQLYPAHRAGLGSDEESTPNAECLLTADPGCPFGGEPRHLDPGDDAEQAWLRAARHTTLTHCQPAAASTATCSCVASRPISGRRRS